MENQFDEKELAKQLNCDKIEYNLKPTVLANVLNNEQSLVIVVDMINGFCKVGALSSPRCKAVIEPIKNLLDKLPNAKKVFVRDCHSQNAAEFKFFPVHCADENESALVDELKGYNGIDLPKNSTNGFNALLAKLPNLEFYNHFIVVGVCTDICVMQLALSLRSYLNETNLDASVITFTDCCETFDAPNHNADLSNLFALKFMSGAGIKIFKKVI